MIKRNGFAQIPLMIALLLMAIAIPVATKMVGENQDNRNRAAANSVPAPAGSACKYCLNGACIAWTPGPHPGNSMCPIHSDGGMITPTPGPGGACVCVNGVYVGVGACLGKPCNITPTPVGCYCGPNKVMVGSCNDTLAGRPCNTTPAPLKACVVGGCSSQGSTQACTSGGAAGVRTCNVADGIISDCLVWSACKTSADGGGYGVCACIGGINYGVGVCNGTKCAAPTYVPQPGDYGVCACIGGINYGVGSCRGTACNVPTGTACKPNGASTNTPSSCCSRSAAYKDAVLTCVVASVPPTSIPKACRPESKPLNDCILGGVRYPWTCDTTTGLWGCKKTTPLATATPTVKPTVTVVPTIPPGGGGTTPLATPTKTPGGGGGGGTCTNECPSSDGVLRSCNAAEGHSICNATGRIAACGGQQFCCPVAGGAWTPNLTLCPGTPTLTPTPTVVAGSEPVLKFRMAFAGINTAAACALSKDLPLSVIVRNNDGTNKTYTGVIATKVNNTSGNLAYYDVSLRLVGFTQTGKFSVFVKSPKHLQVKYGINSQAEYYNKAGGELEGMTSDPATTPVFSFEKYPLLAGDVTGPDGKQDGVVDGRDFVFVGVETIKRTEVGSGGYMLSDLNGNCKMESQDLSLLMISLSVKQGQLY